MAMDFVRWAFREVVEKRKWSWLIKRSQFLMLNQYTTGTASVTFMQNTVTGAGTSWTTAMIGLQFRVGLLLPIYTITAVNVGTQTLTLDDIWGGATGTLQGYQIYYAYVVPPLDFHSFVSVWDPQFSWRLWIDLKQDALNTYDAQRSAQGSAYVVADYDYTNLALGGQAISPPLPRFEIWPHQVTQKTFPFLYESRPPDLDDAGATLPRFIPGNVLMEGALAQCAKWPGPDSAHKNPYFNLQLAQIHNTAFAKMIRELEVQDDEVYSRDVDYSQVLDMAFAPYPFPVNAGFLQLHAI